MAIPNPNPNIADGVKSDVTTYSSNKIESLISVATELPIPAAGDAGKVLTVNSDADGYELTTPVAPTSIIDDSASSETTVYSSDKVDNIAKDITDADNITVTVDSSIDSSLVNCNVRNGLLVLDGRIASTAGVAISTAIFTIPGYNLTEDQQYCYFGLVETATPLNSYAYAENDGNNIKVYISTAIPAGGKIFFFNASMLVDKAE